MIEFRERAWISISICNQWLRNLRHTSCLWYLEVLEEPKYVNSSNDSIETYWILGCHGVGIMDKWWDPSLGGGGHIFPNKFIVERTIGNPKKRWPRRCICHCDKLNQYLCAKETSKSSNKFPIGEILELRFKTIMYLISWIVGSKTPHISSYA